MLQRSCATRTGNGFDPLTQACAPQITIVRVNSHPTAELQQRLSVGDDVEPGITIPIPLNASDPDGDDLHWTLRSTDVPFELSPNSGNNGWSVYLRVTESLALADQLPRDITLSLRVIDERGGVAEFDSTVTVYFVRRRPSFAIPLEEAGGANYVRTVFIGSDPIVPIADPVVAEEPGASSAPLSLLARPRRLTRPLRQPARQRPGQHHLQHRAFV